MSHETAPRDSGDRKEGGLKKQPVERDKVQGANRSKNAREDCASVSVQIREKKEKGKVKGSARETARGKGGGGGWSH